MPSKKQRARATKPHSQLAPSDIDTDTANLTDNQASAIPAPPPPRSNTELNFKVLSRWCPQLEKIIAIAPFAVLYLFSAETSQWEKRDTEGSLFVCRLSGAPHPRYRIIILNRKSLENFNYDLVSMDNIEITDEYVIVQIPGKDGVPQIYGIWIYSDRETKPDVREVVAKIIEYCATEVEKYNKSDVTATESAENNQHSVQPHSQPETAQPEVKGQKIDVATLFAKPETGPGSEAWERSRHLPNPRPDLTPWRSPEATPAEISRFVDASNSNFFRAAPGMQEPNQQTAPQSQQNQLLDLFKNAHKD